jgi:hypothetical protein
MRAADAVVLVDFGFGGGRGLGRSVGTVVRWSSLLQRRGRRRDCRMQGRKGRRMGRMPVFGKGRVNGLLGRMNERMDGRRIRRKATE